MRAAVLSILFFLAGKEAAEFFVGKRHHDYLAAVFVIPEVVFFLNVDCSKCHCTDFAFLININTGPF